MDKILIVLIIVLLASVFIVLGVSGYYGNIIGGTQPTSTTNRTGTTSTSSQPQLGIGTTTSPGVVRTEKLIIESAFVAKQTDGNFTLYLSIKNTGNMTIAIHEIFINDFPHDKVKGWISITPIDAIGHILEPGDTYEIQIVLDGDYFHSGETIMIKILTATGRSYPIMVTLP